MVDVELYELDRNDRHPRRFATLHVNGRDLRIDGDETKAREIIERVWSPDLDSGDGIVQFEDDPRAVGAIPAARRYAARISPPPASRSSRPPSLYANSTWAWPAPPARPKSTSATRALTGTGARPCLWRTAGRTRHPSRALPLLWHEHRASRAWWPPVSGAGKPPGLFVVIGLMPWRGRRPRVRARPRLSGIGRRSPTRRC